MRPTKVIPTWGLWVFLLVPATMAYGRPAYTDTPQVENPKRLQAWIQTTPAIRSIAQIQDQGAHMDVDLKARSKLPSVEKVHTTLVTVTSSEGSAKTRARKQPPDPFIPGGITIGHLEPHTLLALTPTTTATGRKLPPDPFITGGKTITKDHLQTHTLLHPNPSTPGRIQLHGRFIPGRHTKSIEPSVLSSTSHTTVPTREPFLPTALPDFLPAFPSGQSSTSTSTLNTNSFPKSKDALEARLKGHDIMFGKVLKRLDGPKGKVGMVHRRSGFDGGSFEDLVGELDGSL